MKQEDDEIRALDTASAMSFIELIDGFIDSIAADMAQADGVTKERLLSLLEKVTAQRSELAKAAEVKPH